MSHVTEQIEHLTVLPQSMAVWGLGQMGVGIKTPHTLLYIDPCLSDVLLDLSDIWVRAFPPPVPPDQLPPAHYYLITHEHLDHLDPQTIAPYAKHAPNTRYVAPGWCTEDLLKLGIPLEQIITPPALTPIQLPDSDVTLTAIPAAHYEKEYDAEKGFRWMGYLIQANDVTFYHSGDTLIYPGYIEMMRELPMIDVAMMATNGRDYFRETEGPALGNLHPVEAARLARDLGWDTLIIGHNDQYPFNRITFSSVIAALETVAPRQKYKQLQPGELLYYVK